ncbi:glycosyltransferase family protein [Labrenzia sp. MBR-25]
MLSTLADTRVDLLAQDCPRGEVPKVDGVENLYFPSDFMFTGSGESDLLPGLKITARTAPLAVKILQEANNYDFAVVRGFDEASSISDTNILPVVPYITNLSPNSILISSGKEKHLSMSQLFRNAPLVLAQTEGIRQIFEEIEPSVSGKTVLMKPLLPEEIFSGAVYKPNHKLKASAQLVYAGKFASEWGTRDLIRLTQDLQKGEFDCAVHVFGDKVHVETPDFGTEVRSWLNSDLITHHGRADRSVILSSLRDADIGYAYRSGNVVQSPEISTKLLEYIATDTVPILNRSPIHEKYMGTNYPYFADSYDELWTVVQKAIKDGEGRKKHLKMAKKQIAEHRESNIRDRLNSVFRRMEPQSIAINGKQKKKLLISGHDLKFMGPLKQKLLHPKNFMIDTEERKNFRDIEGNGNIFPEQYDFIFCEWAAGNAVQYSRRKQPHQKLVVRFHRFEITTEMPQQIDIINVDYMVFVSEHLRQDALKQYGWPIEKTRVISNMIDVESYDRKKSVFSRFNLGILGILPKLKRFDLALDLLEKLREKDRRYQLHVKGRMPWELEWLWRSKEQKDYFEELFNRIRNTPDLLEGVVFAPFGADTPRWFEKIGWVLSVSDIESFHLAAIEGMASGSCPIVRERHGASDIFQPTDIYEKIDDMTAAILEKSEMVDSPASLETNKNWAMKYDIETLTPAWAELFSETE